MHKYKQNTDQSLYVDNSSRFPGMTELTDSEVEKQKQPLLNAPIGEKQINKQSQESLRRSKCISFLFCYVGYGIMQYQGTSQINSDLNSNYTKINWIAKYVFKLSSSSHSKTTASRSAIFCSIFIHVSLHCSHNHGCNTAQHHVFVRNASSNMTTVCSSHNKKYKIPNAEN